MLPSFSLPPLKLACPKTRPGNPGGGGHHKTPKNVHRIFNAANAFLRPLVFLTATTADTATTAWILGLRVRSLSAVGQKVRTNSSANRVFCTFPGISAASPCMTGPVTGLSQNQNGRKLPRTHSITAPLQVGRWQHQTKTHPCGQLAHRPAPPAASRRRW